VTITAGTPTTFTHGTGLSSFDVGFTVASGSNRALICSVSCDHPTANLCSGMDWNNGETMSVIRAQNSGSWGATYTYGRIAPGVATDNVTISYSANPGVGVGFVQQYDGVDQATAFDNAGGQVVIDGMPPRSTTVTSRNGDMVVFICGLTNDFGSSFAGYEGSTLIHGTNYVNDGNGALGQVATREASTSTGTLTGATWNAVGICGAESWFNIRASGGVTLSAATVTSVTSTQATPRVTLTF
jgi:hypothetical protein